MSNIFAKLLKIEGRDMIALLNTCEVCELCALVVRRHPTNERIVTQVLNTILLLVEENLENKIKISSKQFCQCIIGLISNHKSIEDLESSFIVEATSLVSFLTKDIIINQDLTET